MKYCVKCGHELLEEAVACPSCGCSATFSGNEPLVQTVIQPDEVSVGLCILSFLIPLFGIIYWALKSKETPKKAKACGIAGLIGWGVNLLISIISLIPYFYILNSTLDELLRIL